MKKCRICELPKPLTDYHVRVASKDGRASKCKECRNEEQRMIRYLKAEKKDSILLKRESFATMYPDINRSNFKSWIYRNTEIKSMKGIFGEELFQLVLRFMDRPIQRDKYNLKGSEK